MAKNEKILVIKHGALGDILQGFDAFASLRAHFADAHMAVLTTPAFAGLLFASGWFDEVLIDRRKPVWYLVSGYRTLSYLRAGWTHIIDMQCSRRTAHYARFAPASARWFGTAASASDRLPDFTGVNNAERMLITAKLAGAPPKSAALDWMMSSAMPEQAVHLAPHSYAVLFAGCSLAKPQKRWPAEKFSQIARFATESGITAVLAGTNDDRSANDEVKRHFPNVLDLTAQTDLMSLARLLASARFVIGNDTGPVFMAATCGVPTLMVMGEDTNPEMSAPVGAQVDYLRHIPLSDLSPDKVITRLRKMASIDMNKIGTK